MSGITLNCPPGMPVSEAKSYLKNKPTTTQSLCSTHSHVKGDNSEFDNRTLCCGCLNFTNQSGSYNMKSCGLCCCFGCTIGWSEWAKYCFPIVCCFIPILSCGKECGCGAGCCGTGCFLGTQSQTVYCCCSIFQYGNRNIDK